jgi:hypothetical protein
LFRRIPPDETIRGKIQQGQSDAKLSYRPNGIVPRTPVVERPENAAAREPEDRAGGLKNRCNW